MYLSYVLWYSKKQNLYIERKSKFVKFEFEIQIRKRKKNEMGYSKCIDLWRHNVGEARVSPHCGRIMSHLCEAIPKSGIPKIRGLGGSRNTRHWTPRFEEILFDIEHETYVYSFYHNTPSNSSPFSINKTTHRKLVLGVRILMSNTITIYESFVESNAWI